MGNVGASCERLAEPLNATGKVTWQRCLRLLTPGSALCAPNMLNLNLATVATAN